MKGSFLSVVFLVGLAVTAKAQTDLDYYSLQLTNRARTNPIAENFIQGTSYGTGVVTPLAYNPLVGDAAANHTNWMYQNRANTNITNPSAPLRSAGHYQSDTAGSGGSPLPTSPGYTGFSAGDRMDAAGYARNWWGENIFLFRSTAADAFDLDTSEVDTAHSWWWNSSGHRANMVNSNYRAYGYGIMDYAITDTTNTNLPVGTQSIFLATQAYASPQSGPNSHLFGLLYNDRDENGDWTIRADGDPLREGLAGFNFEVLDSLSSTLVTTGTTFDNGAFTAQVASGTYDLVFDMGSFDFVLEDIAVSTNWNTDIGVVAVPEPSSAALVGLGIAVFAWRKKKLNAYEHEGSR